MRILMITPELGLDLDVRGFIHAWIETLSRRTERLHVAALKLGQLDLPSNVSASAFGHPSSKTLTALALQRMAEEQIPRIRPDVVFVHMIAKFALVIAPVCRLHGIPMVMWYTHGHLSWQARLAYHLVDSVCTASPEGFRLVSHKVHPIGHGIDTAKFHPVEEVEHPSRIVSIGRLSPSKNHPTLIRAVSLLRDQGLDIPPVHIIGQPWPGNPRDELYSEELRTQVVDLGLQKEIHFDGARPYADIDEVYRGSLALLPSLTGSLDKAGLEAMSSGTLLATCNESFRPILGPIAPELLFRAQDAEDCARSIRWMLGLTSARRRTLGAALRGEVLKHHGLESMMDKLVAECRVVSEPHQ